MRRLPTSRSFSVSEVLTNLNFYFNSFERKSIFARLRLEIAESIQEVLGKPTDSFYTSVDEFAIHLHNSALSEIYNLPCHEHSLLL